MKPKPFRVRAKLLANLRALWSWWDKATVTVHWHLIVTVAAAICLLLVFIMAWPTIQFNLNNSGGCPDWFVEYASTKLQADECNWGKPYPASALPLRGRVRAIIYPEKHGDLIREKVFLGFSASQFGLLKGKTTARVRSFGPVTDAQSEYAKKVSFISSTISLELEVEDLLKRNYGIFSLNFTVERPILEEEAKLFTHPRRTPNYDVAVEIQEIGDQLVFSLTDPRQHLFYYSEVERGRDESVAFWMDKWYHPDSSVKRVVITAMRAR